MLSVYEVLAEASRRSILMELRTGPKNVSDLVVITGLKQPNVSNHLARMRSRGIVRATKVGRQVYYVLASRDIEAMLNAAASAEEQETSAIDLEQLVKTYAKAAVQGDESTCQEVVDRAMRSGKKLLDIYEDLLTSAMSMVGSWFSVEAIDVAQEHMASSITERMMARSMMAYGSVQGHGKLAVLGCPPNGWHVIGLRMVGDHLRTCGWRTLFLGANVPLEGFIDTVRSQDTRLVLTSCSADESLPDSLALLQRLARCRERRSGFLIGIGGASVKAHGETMIAEGAAFTACTLRSFAESQLPSIEKTGSLG